MSINVRRAQRDDEQQLVNVKPYWGDDQTPDEYVDLRFRQVQAGELVYLIAELDAHIIGNQPYMDGIYNSEKDLVIDRKKTLRPGEQII